MNLIFRLIWILAAAFRRSKLEFIDESVIGLRVLLNDLDSNFHMNNGRYMTIMDLGRVDLIIRSGILKVIRERKWYPVVGSAKMVFRRPLDPFQKYDLKTRIIGWDEKWIYLEQDFMIGETLHARGVVKTLFLKGREKVPTAELAAAVGHDGPSPNIDVELLKALA